MSGRPTRFEDDVVISGIGQSAVGRRLGRAPLSLTLDAVTDAMRDAGLTSSEIGAVATYPGAGTAVGAGFAGPSVADVYDALGIEPDYVMGGFEGPAQLGPVLNASLAISAGLVRHALVFRTVTEGSSRQDAKASAAGPWTPPAGGSTSPQTVATLARRHFHDYGTTREQLAQIALTARTHAGLNPKAVYRDPLTLADYLSARTISDPLCLYDCDVHCDGSTAFVLSYAGYGTDAPRPVVRIEAIGGAPAPRSEYALQELPPSRRAAAQMWSRTDMRPADVDVAGLYDGFSILTMFWLESLGFCGQGESGPFVAGGTRISLGGELPINTNGGQLSGGRLHGFGFIHEMCLQLRGQAEGRQVPSAKVAAVAVGAAPYMGCMLLRTDS